MQAAWYPRLEPLCVFSWISRSNCRPAELESAHAESGMTREIETEENQFEESS